MLSRLISGAEETSCILLIISDKDSTACEGILKLFSKKLLRPQDTLLISTSPYSTLSLEVNHILEFNDFLGWQSGEQPAALDSVSSKISKETPNLIINNLTDLLVFYKHTSVTRLLKNFRENCGKTGKLVTLIHRDCLQESVIEDIQKFFSTVVTLSCHDEEEEFVRLCDIKHLKQGGKLTRSKELLKFDKEHKIRIESYKEELKQKLIEEEEEAVEKLATFNLSTNRKKEKEAKDKLVLPFYKEPQKIGEVNIQSSGSNESEGKIYYEPDSGDDWDDEDPDDDLDF